MSHRLTVDFQSGVFVASCSCGEWTTSMAALGSERASDVYARIEEAHRTHTEAVERPESVPPSATSREAAQRAE